MRWVVKGFMFSLGILMVVCVGVNIFISQDFLLAILSLIAALFDFYQAFTF